MKRNKAQHANIPIFIPHEGCPNGCVFCNQRRITGNTLCADRDIVPEIEGALSTIGTKEAQIAFFGGSFTGIDRNVMIRLLDDAYEFVKKGLVSSIRLSTRPDYISCEILDILLARGVKTIELGIQSADDGVLAASKRGHTFADSERACRMIKEYGFELGGQMMIGLPGSTPDSEIETARRICELGADQTRIYPTVVFWDTELCEMAQKGEYSPISIDDAVVRTAQVYKVFLAHGVTVLRVGLQSGEGLSDTNSVYAGANHPALGELCESLIYRDIIKDSLCDIHGFGRKKLVISCPFGEVSKIVGQKRMNKTEITSFLREKGVELSDFRVIECFDEKFRVETKLIDQ